MFSGSQQSGFISIFYSVGSNPLALWDKQVKNGHIRRVIDDEVKSLVLDIGGTNVATTYITCPIMPRASLAVRLPYLVMIIKNMKKYFSFEIQILDDKDMRRRFRVSNFQSTTKVRPFCTTMPIGLSAGWNQVQFNLADFTKRAYGSMYIETVRVQIHANVRIRRIYFTDQLHSDEDLPNEFKLFAPGTKDISKDKAGGKEKKSSKEALISQQEPAGRGGSLVPPIKIEPKPDEEIPPPPTPAEESPILAEEPSEHGAEETAPILEESAAEEVPAVATAEIPAGAEGEPTEEAPTDTENAPEEAAAPPPAAEEEIDAGEEIPVEIKQEASVEGEITAAAAAAGEPDEPSPEAGIEAVVEVSAEAEAGVTEVPPPILEEGATAVVTEEVAEETPALTDETAETPTTDEAPSEPTEAETTDTEA